jgi:hypothetical protein
MIAGGGGTIDLRCQTFTIDVPGCGPLATTSAP